MQGDAYLCMFAGKSECPETIVSNVQPEARRNSEPPGQRPWCLDHSTSQSRLCGPWEREVQTWRAVPDVLRPKGPTSNL